MTKLLAIIILIILSSCSYINYAVIPLVRTAVIGVPDADLQEVDKFDFSFARMRMGGAAHQFYFE